MLEMQNLRWWLRSYTPRLCVWFFCKRLLPSQQNSMKCILADLSKCILNELSSFPVTGHSPGSTGRSLTKYLALRFLIMSSFLHCCNLLPVDVSSELVKVCSVFTKVIKISGSVGLTLTFGIRLVVQIVSTISLFRYSMYDQCDICKERIQTE